jgi:hypothetical protein
MSLFWPPSLRTCGGSQPWSRDRHRHMRSRSRSPPMGKRTVMSGTPSPGNAEKPSSAPVMTHTPSPVRIWRWAGMMA